MGRADTDSYPRYNSDGAAKVGHFFSLAASIAILGGLHGINLATVQAQPAPLPRSGGYGLQMNDSGANVADLQHRLSEMGYYTGPVDGIFSGQTQEAVYRFQQSMGLTADGVVGPATTQALYGGVPANPAANQYSRTESETANPRSAVQLNDSGNQIIELQRRLSDLGYYSSDFSGVFDYSTEAAVMQFQRDNGLTADGIVGESTAAAMRQPTEAIIRPGASPNQDPATPQPATAAAGDQIEDGLLGLGDTGQAVSDLQLRLKELGFYQGEVTGTFGPETESAVVAFQQSSGLTTDGIAGPQVSSALYSFSEPNGFVGTSSNGVTNAGSGSVPPSRTASGSSVTTTGAGTTNNTANTAPVNGAPASGNSSINSSTNSAVQSQELEQARLQAEQAQLQAEQAQVVLFQNLEEGKYSVAALQRELRDRGYYPGEINGMLTAETQSAIAEAQLKYDLSQTDIFSGNTTTIEIENEAEAVQVPGTVQSAPDALFPY